MRKHPTLPTHRLALAGIIASLLCGNVLADTARYAINGDTQSTQPYNRSHVSLNVLLAGLQPIPNTSIYVWATGSQLGEFCLLANHYMTGQPAWVPAITHTPNGTILKGQAHCPDATAKVFNLHDPSTYEQTITPYGPGMFNNPFIGASKKVWPTPDREVFVPILKDLDLSAPLFDDVKVYVGVVDEIGQQKTEYAEVFAVNAIPTPSAPIDNAFGTTVTLKTGISGEPCSVNFGDDSNQGKTQRYALCPETVEHVYQKPDIYTVKMGRSSGMLKAQVIDVNSDAWFAYAYAGAENLYPTSKADFIHNGIMDFKPTYAIHLPPYSAENLPNDTYSANYGLRRDLPVSGDAFSLEMRVKNAIVPGSTQCSSLNTHIRGENNIGIGINFQTTCEITSYGEHGTPATMNNFKPYDTPRKEIQNSVSVFADNGGGNNRNIANDFNDWHIIKIKAANKTIEVFYDGVEALSSSYKNSIGQLKYLSQSFSASNSSMEAPSKANGSGAIDWVKVYDANDKVVYQEDFN